MKKALKYIGCAILFFAICAVCIAGIILCAEGVYQLNLLLS